MGLCVGNSQSWSDGFQVFCRPHAVVFQLCRGECINGDADIVDPLLTFLRGHNDFFQGSLLAQYQVWRSSEQQHQAGGHTKRMELYLGWHGFFSV